MRLLSLSVTSVLLTGAQKQTAASVSVGAEDFSTMCTFVLQGQPTGASESAAIQRAEIDCSGSSSVQMRIAPALRPFLSAFTGKQVLQHFECMSDCLTGIVAMACPQLYHTDHLQSTAVNMQASAQRGIYTSCIKSCVHYQALILITAQSHIQYSPDNAAKVAKPMTTQPFCIWLPLSTLCRSNVTIYTGVEATVDEAMTNASLSGSTNTALIAIDGTAVRVTDSYFNGLTVPQDTLLLMTNSSLLMTNTTFTGNQAALQGAFIATDVLSVSVQNSTFTSNAGSAARSSGLTSV